jgi:hypothetical protein
LAREAGTLFEYNFPSVVTVKKGQSAMLPFLQQKLEARKVLIYLESFGLNPQSAIEIANTTGKTLDGGPITVYDAGSYAGEALTETVRAGDRRLISYGVDLGTRISTAWGTARSTVREVHLRGGVLTTRTATVETKNYSINNVDAKAKTLIIEHGQRPGFRLVETAKPLETTATAYRFEIKLGAGAKDTFSVREERVDDQTVAITPMPPNAVLSWMQNKTLGADAQRQLDLIVKKKREIVTNDAALAQAEAEMKPLDDDQTRLRRNIDSLRNIATQKEQVETYARQIAANEVKIAGLRDRQSQLRARKAALDGELRAIIAKAEF